MSNRLWFGCPKCFLAFYSKGEYVRHYESVHPGPELKDAELIETKG
jgi:hypothetical protein